MEEKKNGWRTTAIIFIVLTIILTIVSLWFLFSIAIIDQEWTYEYEDLNEDWCEISNDWGDLYNEQLSWLISYDPATWGDSEMVERIDCEVGE